MRSSSGRWRNDRAQELHGSNDLQPREASAEFNAFGSILSHEIGEMTVVPGHEVIRLGCYGEVHITLVLRVTLQHEGTRYQCWSMRVTYEPSQECRHPLCRETRK